MKMTNHIGVERLLLQLIRSCHQKGLKWHWKAAFQLLQAWKELRDPRIMHSVTSSDLVYEVWVERELCEMKTSFSENKSRL